jgi:NAD+ kinase
MRVAIYGRKVNKQTAEYFVKLLHILEEFGWKAVLEEELSIQLIQKAGISENYEIFRDHKDFHSGLDLVISMGGDGTFLKTVSYIRNSGVPIMGINTGRLGFLANISKDAMYETLSQVKNKEYGKMKIHYSSEMYEALEVNIPTNFTINKDTKIYVWDTVNETSKIFNVPELYVDDVNKLHNLEKGHFITQIIRNNLRII